MKKLINKANEIKAAAIIAVLYYPAVANAKLSDRVGGAAKEYGALMSIFLWAVTLFGLGTFVIAIISIIKKKKNNRELDWEMWGVIGGAALAISMLLFTDIAGSLSGNDVKVDLSNPNSSGF